MSYAVLTDDELEQLRTLQGSLASETMRTYIGQLIATVDAYKAPCKCPNCGLVFTPGVTIGKPIENQPGMYQHVNPWILDANGNKIEVIYTTPPTT